MSRSGSLGLILIVVSAILLLGLRAADSVGESVFEGLTVAAVIGAAMTFFGGPKPGSLGESRPMVTL